MGDRCRGVLEVDEWSRCRSRRCRRVKDGGMGQWERSIKIDLGGVVE